MEFPVEDVEHVISGAERLACLLRVGYPNHYPRPGSCRTGLADIPKLIEHLKRHHPTKCPTCKTPFRSTDDFETHRNGSCSRRGHEEAYFLTETQLTKITAMPKRPAGESPNIKWENIYRIIFNGDEDMPSAYVQTLEHIWHVIETRPSGIFHGLQDKLTSNVEDFLSDLREFLYTVSREGRVTGRISATGRPSQTSNAITTGSMELTAESNMELFQEVGNDEYTNLQQYLNFDA